MGEGDKILGELRRLVRERRRYPLEAYMFLYQALDVAQRLVGEKRHVSGRELCEGFRQLAADHFGPLALPVLRRWGVRRTDDLGVMVFDLVERGLMGKTDDDRVEDFDDVFDFADVLDPDRLLAEVDARALGLSLRSPARPLPSGDRAATA